MLIAKGKFNCQSLVGKVAVVTGAGGGIGYEAARALLWLGARVVIAEIDRSSGTHAAGRLNAEFGTGSALFVRTDVGDDHGVQRLKQRATNVFGRADIVINNATFAPLGAVVDVPIRDWDASYRVNLRGPALLARAFIPGMVARGYGVFVCVSSLGQEFMAAYEAVKAAQVQLGSTLAAELEGSGVLAFTIGPGYVPTRTAEGSVPKLAAMMGKSEDELFAIVKQFELPVEAAGAGFAAAVAMAEKYAGQEISSTQALIDAGIEISQADSGVPGFNLSDADFKRALDLCRRVLGTLKEQSVGWKERSVFEYQWMLRSFRKGAGMPVEKWVELLGRMEQALAARDGGALSAVQAPLPALAAFYANLYEMTRGYIQDPKQREEQLAVVQGWREEVEKLASIMKR